MFFPAVAAISTIMIPGDILWSNDMSRTIRISEENWKRMEQLVDQVGTANDKAGQALEPAGTPPAHHIPEADATPPGDHHPQGTITPRRKERRRIVGLPQPPAPLWGRFFRPWGLPQPPIPVEIFVLYISRREEMPFQNPFFLPECVL